MSIEQFSAGLITQLKRLVREDFNDIFTKVFSTESDSSSFHAEAGIPT